MKRMFCLLGLAMCCVGSSDAVLGQSGTIVDESDSVTSEEDEATDTPAAYHFTMQTIDDKDLKLSQYLGKVVMIVNTASECGLTPQYEKLQAMHEKYGEQGLVILGFPCNQFGQQESGTESEIATFCKKNYGVTFQMFAKIDVNGDQACDLYRHLTSLDLEPKAAGAISWNFEKFVLDRAGKPVARFHPKVEPDDEALLKVIQDALKEE